MASRKKLVEDIKQDPAHFYRQPNDVMRDRRFSDAERLEILSAWELAAGEGDLDRVIEALLAVRNQMNK